LRAWTEFNSSRRGRSTSAVIYATPSPAFRASRIEGCERALLKKYSLSDEGAGAESHEDTGLKRIVEGPRWDGEYGMHTAPDRTGAIVENDSRFPNRPRSLMLSQKQSLPQSTVNSTQIRVCLSLRLELLCLCCTQVRPSPIPKAPATALRQHEDWKEQVENRFSHGALDIEKESC